MLFDESLQDVCIQKLKSGSIILTDLVKIIQTQRIGTTKQGVYRALRQLSQKGIVSLHNHEASLNLQWINKINSFSDLANKNYLNPNIKGHFRDIEPGEQITYKFKNATSTDAFWNHAAYVLLEKQDGTDFFSYAPHAWFWMVRSHEELALQEYVNKLGRKYLQTVWHQTNMDLEVANHFNNKESQYTMLAKKPTFKNNYYLNIIGDFLIEVWFSKSFSDKLDHWYQKTDFLNPASLAEFETIINTKQKIKFRISNKPEKASKIRKRLEKLFH